MGYSTDFSGKLLFTKELKASELAELNNFLGKDCREHPEWGNANLSYIDLQLTKDFFGLEWDGSEKTYDLVEKTNLVIENMRIKYPDFGLTGKLLAQGEDIGDAWILAIENGKAKHKKIDLSHKKKITCPHCEEEFFLDEEKKYSFSFVFSGFRDKILENKIREKDWEVTENISKNTTHLVMKDETKISSKKTQALKNGCVILSIEKLANFLNN